MEKVEYSTQVIASQAAPSYAGVFSGRDGRVPALCLDGVHGEDVQCRAVIAAPDAQGDCTLTHWRREAQDRLVADLPNSCQNWLWTLQNPQLCQLTVEARINGVVYEFNHSLALRWLHVGNDRIIRLNGQPIYLRGVIRGITAHDAPNLTGRDDQFWHRKIIAQAKSLGFNLIRWHSTIPNRQYLDECDHIGMLNQVEMGFTKHNGQVTVDASRWEQIIRQTRHHPSIAIYCVGNEIRRAGSHHQVRRLIRQGQELAPGTLVTDSAGWGESDRVDPDVYVQHVAYFFPAFEHADMFEHLEAFKLEGRVGQESHEQAETTTGADSSCIPPLRPTLAHEVCHYIALRDFASLEQKWETWRSAYHPSARHPAAQWPWWAGVTRELLRQKRLADDYPAMLRASRRFQALGQRHVLERIRRSPALQGFEMLQIMDCWKYENSNGLLDCFGDIIHWCPEEFRRFNADSVLLADLPRRLIVGGESLSVAWWLSHYGKSLAAGSVLKLQWWLDGRPSACGQTHSLPVLESGRLHALGTFEMVAPTVSQPTKVYLDAQLLVPGGDNICNRYELWIMPSVERITTEYNDCIIHTMTTDNLYKIFHGASKLWIYRPEHCFAASRPRPELDWSGSRDLFKPCIWDRGHNLGAFIRPHRVLDQLPHEGCIDWPFAGLIHHGVKINLDRFPGAIRPAIEGVDRPVRDRMEVSQFGRGEYQPDHTFRRWGWLFDLAVGKGRLCVCGLNFTRPDPLGDWLLRELVDDLQAPATDDCLHVDPGALEEYWRSEAARPLQPEPPMTAYWLEDRDPVETMLFWEKLGIILK